MRYIKKFESNSKLYWHISFREIINSDRFEFNDNERTKLSLTFNEKYKGGKCFYKTIKDGPAGIPCELRISKLDDNYYLVYYEDEDFDEYHICDDWEGLVLCLDKEYYVKIPMKISDIKK